MRVRESLVCLENSLCRNYMERIQYNDFQTDFEIILGSSIYLSHLMGHVIKWNNSSQVKFYPKLSVRWWNTSTFVTWPWVCRAHCLAPSSRQSDLATCSLRSGTLWELLASSPPSTSLSLCSVGTALLQW